ncbi:hypothetical protein BpHYR1_024802 [Brachionus plicatilis]|uniref:Uncharacterized protein n=1 Tax=Brachionus plicatilis TaxID=10195 RepID=A0A3M7RY16_BRAPC|nr:hypothetical protein BpHYR1_024802 [Brachionus plicatilis]
MPAIRFGNIFAPRLSVGSPFQEGRIRLRLSSPQRRQRNATYGPGRPSVRVRSKAVPRNLLLTSAMLFRAKLMVEAAEQAPTRALRVWRGSGWYNTLLSQGNFEAHLVFLECRFEQRRRRNSSSLRFSSCSLRSRPNTIRLSALPRVPFSHWSGLRAASAPSRRLRPSVSSVSSVSKDFAMRLECCYLTTVLIGQQELIESLPKVQHRKNCGSAHVICDLLQRWRCKVDPFDRAVCSCHVGNSLTCPGCFFGTTTS